jgi:hypothetical protein
MRKLIYIFWSSIQVLLLLPIVTFSQSRIVSETTIDSLLPDGKTHVMSVYSGRMFYRVPVDTTKWDTVSNKWVDSITYWVINRNEYNVRVKKNFIDKETFQFVFDPNDLVFEPDDIIIDSTTILKPQNVTGYLKDDLTIRFDNCYGAGVSYEITGLDGLQIQEIFDSATFMGYQRIIEKDEPGGSVSYDTIRVRKNFQVSFKLVKEKGIRFKDWDGISKISKDQDVSLGFKKYAIKRIEIDKLATVNYTLESKSNKKYLTKVIETSNYRGLRTGLTLIDSAVAIAYDPKPQAVLGASCTSNLIYSAGTKFFVGYYASTDAYATHLTFYLNIPTAVVSAMTINFKPSAVAAYNNDTVYFMQAPAVTQTKIFETSCVNAAGHWFVNSIVARVHDAFAAENWYSAPVENISYFSLSDSTHIGVTTGIPLFRAGTTGDHYILTNSAGKMPYLLVTYTLPGGGAINKKPRITTINAHTP